MKEQFVELVKVWKEDVLGNLITVLFVVASNIFVQMQKVKLGLDVLSLTDGFVTNIFPTLAGAILGFTFSEKPIKQRWQLLLASGLFNAYALDGLLKYFNMSSSVFWYFIGGISAYYLIDLFIIILKELGVVAKNILEHIAPSINRYIEKKLDLKKDDTTEN